MLASPEFKAALKKHYGIDDTALVMVDIWSAGNYGSEEDRTRRLARPLCFLRTDPTDNGYARPIEGLRPVVDLNTMQVIRVEEYGHWPLPPQPGNYAADRVDRTAHRHQAAGDHAARRAELRGRRQPGALAELEFRHRLQRPRRADAAPSPLPRQRPDRSILYRASLTEMVVPYGDPARTQARKNAFDVGEYGMGMCANSLELGCDCLGQIQYFDAHLCDSRGEPLTIKNAICMHEEDFGILWKHTDRRLPTRPEVRRSRRLVVSSISTVENYEYGFFWYLYQDGNIQFEIKLTGILSLGALPPGEKPKYGTMIAPQLYAPNHQHFFNVRLDFDLDGTANSVHQIDVVPTNPGRHNPSRTPSTAQATLLKTEKQARANLNLETARTWKIVNPNVMNAVGEPVGYKFLPGDNCVPVRVAERLVAQAGRLRRSSRLGHAVPRGRERYAAGDYPNQSQGGDGLIDGPRRTGRSRHRRRALVHLRPHAHPAAGRLSGDADGVHRLPAEAERLLRREPGQRCAAVEPADANVSCKHC